MKIFQAKYRKNLVSFMLAAFVVSFATFTAHARKNDEAFHSTCIENKKFTWEGLQKLANEPFLKKQIETDAFKRGENPPLTKEAREMIWSIVTTPELGPMGAGVALTNLSTASNIPGGALKNLDGVLTHLGGILTVVQFYNDVKSGSKMTQVNAVKGSTFWGIGTFGFSTVLKTCAVGISLFDYTLNKLGTETSKWRYGFWEKAYVKYYDKKYGYRMQTVFDAATGKRKISADDTDKWIDLIFVKYKGDMDRALKEGFSDFWADAEVNAIDVGMNPNTGGANFKRNLLKEEQEAIRLNYLRHVLPSVLNVLKWKQDLAIRDLVILSQTFYKNT